MYGIIIIKDIVVFNNYLYLFSKGGVKMINKKKLVDLNETIKNYNEPIVINLNEYKKPYQVVTKNGKETIEKGLFLEINKSNELFKNGKKAIGIIIEILDYRELDMISDLNTFNGNVFLIVEFKNEKGLNYKIKTPAISNKLLNFIEVGQKVDVYYDDTKKQEGTYDIVNKNGKREKQFYDNFDFYVTNIKGKRNSNKPLITKIIAYILLVLIIIVLIYICIK